MSHAMETTTLSGLTSHETEGVFLRLEGGSSLANVSGVDDSNDVWRRPHGGIVSVTFDRFAFLMSSVSFGVETWHAVFLRWVSCGLQKNVAGNSGTSCQNHCVSCPHIFPAHVPLMHLISFVQPARRGGKLVLFGLSCVGRFV